MHTTRNNQTSSEEEDVFKQDQSERENDFDNTPNEEEKVVIEDGPDYDSQSSNEDKKFNTQDERDNSKFKEGDNLTMIRVRFPGNARSFPFLAGKRKFNYGQKVVAMSDRGMTVGYINSLPYEMAFNKSMLPIRSIAKVADAEDIRAQIEFHTHEKKAEVICLKLIDKYKLDMVLTHVEFIQFGKKAVFYFNAPARVDFRDLVKDLVYELKMRIELRQISVRDRAAAIGAIGACGLQTCCSSFLKNYGQVSIKMAKNQNLALIPSKLNGVCGQIKCCIKYEDEVYTDKRKRLPREGSFIQTQNGDAGKVLKLNVLIDQFEMLTDKGIRRTYHASEYSLKNSDLGSEYKFPESFENIINETQVIIGLPKKVETIERPLDEENLAIIEKNNDFQEFAEKDIPAIEESLSLDLKASSSTDEDPRHHQDKTQKNHDEHHGKNNRRHHHRHGRHHHKNRHQDDKKAQSANQQNKPKNDKGPVGPQNKTPRPHHKN